MRRTEKTVITIETFQRTVVRTRRAMRNEANGGRPEETGTYADSETTDPLQQSALELARAADVGGEK